MTDAREDAIHMVDRHVGGRVRLCRKIQGRSQENLALELGLTFQQVQKYERGANRISVSKLYEIAAAFRVPVTYFFEGLAATEGDADPRLEQWDAEILAFLTSIDGLDWVRAISAISSPSMRRRMLELAQGLAAESP